MPAMIESFVDLTYRGLSLGRRVKLADVRPTTGYVEMPAPMPVGTAIAIITDDTVALDAIVVEVHEQVAGSSLPPGMVVRPKLEGDAAKAWWNQRVTMPELAKAGPPAPVPAPPIIPAAPVVVVSKRVTNPGLGVPELLDDGQVTGVMEVAVDPDAESVPVLVDDGKKTTAMDAVDLAALGLTTASSSGQLSSEAASDDDEGGSGNGENGSGDKPEAKSKRKRKRR
jgi:hypothetical protein